MVINKHISTFFTASSVLSLPGISGCLATSPTTCSSLLSLFTVLPSPPFSSLAPRGVCSLRAAIHQACHRSLRGGWRGLRGTRLISLLWLSRPAQRERAPATRAFAPPSSTSSSSSSSSHFSAVFLYLFPLQSVQLLHSPISSQSLHLFTSLSPTLYRSACMTYMCALCLYVNTWMHWESQSAPPRLQESLGFKRDEKKRSFKELCLAPWNSLTV